MVIVFGDLKITLKMLPKNTTLLVVISIQTYWRLLELAETSIVDLNAMAKIESNPFCPQSWNLVVVQQESTQPARSPNRQQKRDPVHLVRSQQNIHAPIKIR